MRGAADPSAAARMAQQEYEIVTKPPPPEAVATLRPSRLPAHPAPGPRLARQRSEAEIEAELARAWMIDQAWKETGDKAWEWIGEFEYDPETIQDDNEVRNLYIEQWLGERGYDVYRLISDKVYARRSVMRTPRGRAIPMIRPSGATQTSVPRIRIGSPQ